MKGCATTCLCMLTVLAVPGHAAEDAESGRTSQRFCTVETKAAQIPDTLAVVGLEAPDAAGAMRVAQPIVNPLQRGAEAVPFARGDATLYRQLSEVKSR